MSMHIKALLESGFKLNDPKNFSSINQPNNAAKPSVPQSVMNQGPPILAKNVPVGKPVVVSNQTPNMKREENLKKMAGYSVKIHDPLGFNSAGDMVMNPNDQTTGQGAFAGKNATHFFKERIDKERS